MFVTSVCLEIPTKILLDLSLSLSPPYFSLSIFHAVAITLCVALHAGDVLITVAACTDELLLVVVRRLQIKGSPSRVEPGWDERFTYRRLLQATINRRSVIRVHYSRSARTTNSRLSVTDLMRRIARTQFAWRFCSYTRTEVGHLLSTLCVIKILIIKNTHKYLG